jgi:RhtB (resistance to homoserine/threonine) family protein
MHDYALEFAQVAIAHLLAVASPGPDFALVLKQSLVHGRRTALATTWGIGAGNLLHVTYSLLGLGLLIRSSEVWFNAAKFAGAAYLAWLGVQSLRARPRNEALADAAMTGVRLPGGRSAFAAGFFTCALNPKATLFFISLFALLVSPRTPKLIQAGYGLWMSCATVGWFSFVAVLFTRDAVRRHFLHFGHWIDWTMGVVLLAFAVSLVVATMR